MLFAKVGKPQADDESFYHIQSFLQIFFSISGRNLRALQGLTSVR